MKRLFCLSLFLCTILSGCNDDRITAVEKKMDDIKNKPKPEVPKPPVFQAVRSFSYQSDNLRSPFMPPTLSERMAAELTRSNNQVEPDRDRPPEPLEDYEITQLSMKGIIDDNDGTRYALVEDPTGTLNKIEVGNHMGKNFGRVVAINAREIELIEIVEDGKSGFIERPKTLLAAEN